MTGSNVDMAEPPTNDIDSFEIHDEVHAEPDVSEGLPPSSFDVVDGDMLHTNGHEGAPLEAPGDFVSGSDTSNPSLSTLVSSATGDPPVSSSEAAEPVVTVPPTSPSGSIEQHGSATDRANTPVLESQAVLGDRSLIPLSSTATLLSIDNPTANSLAGETTL